MKRLFLAALALFALAFVPWAPPTAFAEVIQVNGKARATRPGVTKPIPLRAGSKLLKGDVVKVETGTMVILAYGDGIRQIGPTDVLSDASSGTQSRILSTGRERANKVMNERGVDIGTPKSPGTLAALARIVASRPTDWQSAIQFGLTDEVVKEPEFGKEMNRIRDLQIADDLKHRLRAELYAMAGLPLNAIAEVAKASDFGSNPLDLILYGDLLLATQDDFNAALAEYASAAALATAEGDLRVAGVALHAQGMIYLSSGATKERIARAKGFLMAAKSAFEGAGDVDEAKTLQNLLNKLS